MEHLTDVELQALEFLATLGEPCVPCAMCTDEQTETLLGLGYAGLVTITGQERGATRVRYWTITDAGRYVLGQETARREVACCG